jgi:multidrug resistance efflux pump
MAALQPSLHPDVVFRRRDGAWIMLTASGVALRLKDAQVALLHACDGTRDAAGLVAFAAQMGHRVGTSAVDAFLQQMLHHGAFVEGGRRSRIRVERFFAVTLSMANPMALLTPLARLARPVGSRAALVLYALLLVSAARLAPDLDIPPLRRALEPAALATLWVTSFVAITLHELGHALTCVHFGAPVRRMGIGCMVGLPIAFSDVTGSHLFQKKRERLLVIAAGLLTTLACLAAVIHVAFLLPTGAVRTGLLAYLVVGTTGVAANLAPFLRLDGYFLLAEAVDSPDLWTRSFEALGRVGARVLVGPGPSRVVTRQTLRRAAYAALASATGAWVGVRAIGWLLEELVSALRAWGAILALALIAVVVAPALARGFRALARAFRALATDERRAFATRTGACLGLLLALLALVPSREDADATFVIVAAEHVPVRARVPGTIVRVLVHRGEHVERGRPLVELESPRLVHRRALGAAMVAGAEAELARCRAGSLPAEIARTRAHAAAADESAAQSSRERSRVEMLANGGALTHEELDRANAHASGAVARAGEARASLSIETSSCRPEQREAAEARLEGARRELAAAEADLRDLIVRSPLDGVVMDAAPDERVGAVVAGGDRILDVQSVARVAELTPSWLWAHGPSGDAKLVLETGETIRTSLAAQLPSSDADGLQRLRSHTLAASPVTGATGRARVYGPRVSYGLEYVVHPAERMVHIALGRF